MNASAEATIRAGAPTRDRFYVYAAYACLAVVFIGFAPTYWVPMARGTLDVPPISHVHAVLFFGWMVLFVQQALRAYSGNMIRHREWGVAGVAIATAMSLVGLAMAIVSIRHFEAAGQGPAARAFASLPVTGIVLFLGLIAAAVMNVRKPEIHKRLMLVATVSLLQPAIGRLFAIVLAPPGAAQVPPVFVTLPPAFLSDLVIVAAMIHDKKTLGRVHPAYWIGGALLLGVQLVRIPLGPSNAWMEFTRWLMLFAP